MSLLNKIGGPGNAWAAANVKSKAFDRVDTNDDRKLDQAELQATFDAVAARTGKTARDAEAVIAKMDTDSLMLAREPTSSGVPVVSLPTLNGQPRARGFWSS